MTYEQYWHGDPNLLSIYYKSYMQKLHQEAHIYGYYQFKALESALYNTFSGMDGKQHTPIEYLREPLITAESWNKKKITQENLDEEYKKELNYQIDWVNALSNNK